MMIKRLIVMASLAVTCLIPASLMADQFSVGLGLAGITPGQAKTKVDRFPVVLAYEGKDLWRYSYSDLAFKTDTTPAAHQKVMIIGAEKMWVHKMKPGLAIIGGFGPGYYSTSGDGGSGSAVGLLASGTIRFSINKEFFVDGSLHYRNAAITIDNDVTYNGGYQGVMVGFGYFF